MREDANPYLHGAYAPIDVETSVEATEVTGDVPRDLSGTYVRNGPNPRFPPPGRHHWFDGDAMLHAARITDGRVFYTNRWIQTAGFRREVSEGRALWSGIMESSRNNPREAPYKDTANTDVVPYAGGLLATWWLAGDPYLVDARTLETRGVAPFREGSDLKVASHAKVDLETGELFFFDYGLRPPFMRFASVPKSGERAQVTPIELPGPRLPHDMAISEHHAILMDLPVLLEPTALRERRWASYFDRELPARFGVIAKRGGAVRWFEAEPCYVYHAINAYEDGDAIVLTGCRVEDPVPTPDPSDGTYARMMANLRVDARLHEWRFDLKTGQTSERRLGDDNLEFPTINMRWLGKKSRYGYLSMIAPERTLLFEGVMKHDAATGATEPFRYGPGRFGSQPAFAPRVGATAEDDGYLTTFVWDEGAQASELVILDARELGRGPVARVRIPTRIPHGFHACFVEDEAGR